ncbi:MAG: RecX family transcriptional regulator [Acholeplasmataceae bacterium]|jgi:SOS response regulatory protein OraA/RecX|nr:RecX family transcriptional regulator [Acholeplasmataceae bacterium]
MKTINQLVKKKNQYLVTFGDDEPIIFDPEIVLKYRLKIGSSFDVKTYHQLIEDNNFNIFYQLAIKKLKKMMTIHEMKVYLITQGASEAITKQMIKKLKDKKYLDDEIYLKTYISLKAHQHGPKKLSYDLKQKGIPFEFIENALNEINESEVIQSLMDKKIPSLKQKPYQQKVRLLKSFLLQKGFSNEAIDHELSTITYDQQSDITSLIKDYEKLNQKIKSDDLYEKNQKIIQKLYQKGYRIEDIKKIIHH